MLIFVTDTGKRIRGNQLQTFLRHVTKYKRCSLLLLVF